MSNIIKNKYNKKTCRWGLLAIFATFIIISPLYNLGDGIFEGKYLPLMIMIGLSPFVVLFDGYKADRNLALLACILTLMFLGGNLFHPESFRINSFIYTIGFFLLYLSYDVVIQKNAIPLQTFKKFLKFLIYAYSLVLFIQQIEVLAGIAAPINLMNFGGRGDNPFKLNSLTMEPSNLAIILPCVMFCFIKTQEILRGETKYITKHIMKEDRKIWVLFLYASFTNGAVTSFFSVAVLSLYFVNKKNFKYVPLIVVLLIGVIFVATRINSKINDRMKNLFDVNYQSTEMIVDTDASSAVRIVPFIIYFKSLGLNAETILGHGMDALETRANENILNRERIINGDRVGADSMINTFYDYGLICGLIFLIFILKNVSPKFISFETLFYFLVYIVLPMNHFVLWGFIFCMMTVKKYQLIYKKRNDIVNNYSNFQCR